MYFNLDENHPETPRLASSLSVLERVLATVVVYLLIVIAVIVVPRTEWYQAQLAAQQRDMEARQQEIMEKQRENARFVFMAPKVDIQRAPDKPAELSDIDRRASSVERPPMPRNPLPFVRGNSAERVEADTIGPREPRPEPPSTPPAGEPEATRPPLTVPAAPTAPAVRIPETAKPQGSSTGILSEAIRNVQKYAKGETFNNPQGGAPQENFPSIQFDSKGVDFGPWLRRFVAQIKRNWFIPDAAMFMKGHVVITFNVHRDGRITDLQVVKPTGSDALNNSAFNALAASNPTQQLPPEYPDNKAFFTVTFYFNESPPR